MAGVGYGIRKAMARRQVYVSFKSCGKEARETGRESSPELEMWRVLLAQKIWWRRGDIFSRTATCLTGDNADTKSRERQAPMQTLEWKRGRSRTVGSLVARKDRG